MYHLLASCHEDDSEKPTTASTLSALLLVVPLLVQNGSAKKQQGRARGGGEIGVCLILFGSFGKLPRFPISHFVQPRDWEGSPNLLSNLMLSEEAMEQEPVFRACFLLCLPFINIHVFSPHYAKLFNFLGIAKT